MSEVTPGAVAIVAVNDLASAAAFFARFGFAGEDDGDDDYLMLADAYGGRVHLTRAEPGWVEDGRNPFGLYLYRPDVAALADLLADAIVEPGGAADRPWGMYEFAVNGPDGLLVRIGWPSQGR